MTKFGKQDVHVGHPDITTPKMGVNRNACPYCGAKGYVITMTVIEEIEQEVRMTCEDCGGTGVKA